MVCTDELLELLIYTRGADDVSPADNKLLQVH